MLGVLGAIQLTNRIDEMEGFGPVSVGHYY